MKGSVTTDQKLQNKSIKSETKIYNSDTTGAKTGGKITIASPESSFKID